MAAKLAHMPAIVFNALFSSFFLVRVVKGRWTRHPHYLAVALVGAVIALLALQAASPGSESSFIAGNLAALAGAWGGVMLYDLLFGAA